ncbi:histidine--tRNA ligase [Candidatus Falkowbacteria bacterium CG10_big_fil_rev_8_21_14_0_10_39_11]|uniref:Histidine--tRNA ligase n=1 Tax=Candidatus Falkowbacteria bacterium CG10_big_fil_rev_8_21_14_0_10_39_11 TaxID=1974565 RepID=A0A2H0V4Y7_9BACT|nr:MAG: histidine--tRNA ligase [Candidatus Falkowbacteria bacterium CG10_big_fil_rev_8_21_14_0_10_39_11]
MSKTNLQRAKGVRDFGPAEKIERDRIIGIMKQVFESFGFSPIETPIIERYDTFASKYAQGQESDAMKESFKFTDQGKRDLVLRNDFTVPLSRFVAMNSDLPMPFKRYQMGQIFRDGPIKLGRYREFWQCDVDIVGRTNIADDAEVIQVILSLFDQLELDVEVVVNNRKIINAVLSQNNIPEKIREDFIISLDKIEKIGIDAVKEELEKKGITEKATTQILSDLGWQAKDNQARIKKLNELIEDKSGLEEMSNLLYLLNDPREVRFLPSLARGLAYYTGTVFEVVLKDQSKLSSSLAGGGRYDKMMAEFTGNKDLGGVGVGFGLETIFDAISLMSKGEEKQTMTQVYIVPLGADELKASMKVANRLREQGLNVDVDKLERKPQKKMKYANELKIPYVAVIGGDELNADSVMLKNMESGEQELVKVDEVKLKIQKYS